MADIKCFQNGNDLIVAELSNFNVTQTFDCGQCFRFDFTSSNTVRGVALGRIIEITQPSDDTIIIKNMTPDDFENTWKRYLGLDENYSLIRQKISTVCPNDKILSEAMKVGHGIRIMKQDPWETLCSFIVSQNNNIPRIKGIIKTMSEKFGTPLYNNNGTISVYNFPTPESICNAGVDQVFACKTGFRAKYIVDAAQKVVSGEIDFGNIEKADTITASDELCKIKGVGKKVAACSLLFGFDKKDAFPIDVWVKRVLSKYYGEEFQPEYFGKYAGIAQQYLFYYERYVNSREGVS